MGPQLRGVPFHGEFSSADASALSEVNARIKLYGSNSVGAITLASTDIVTITDCVLAAGATGLTVQIYDGPNNVVDAGESITKAALVATTSVYPDLTQGHDCQAGTYPKVKTNIAGQVDVSIKGVIKTVGA
jgi:hypothetical protein